MPGWVSGVLRWVGLGRLGRRPGAPAVATPPVVPAALDFTRTAAAVLDHTRTSWVAADATRTSAPTLDFT